MTEFNTRAIIRFLKSTTGRLTLTYLAIIMLMSIGFSVVFYNTSSHQLGRQIPPAALYENSTSPFPHSNPQRRADFEGFFRQRIDEGRRQLLVRLIWLNTFALVAGGVLSYALARRTLKPIEDAMEAQGRFVSDASHELRTPITVLQTTNEVALRKPKLSTTEAKDLIRHNVAEAIKLKDLTDGLLGLLRQDEASLTLEPVSLQDIVGEAMNRVIAPATEKGITINDNVPDIKVRGNRQALVLLTTILLDNAIKYSHNKCTVTMEATQKSNNAYLTIKDEGVGINASDIPHIFERFYRADRSRSKEMREGYGLGLAIAQRIVERHHGAVSVESTPNHGSAFTVSLPLAKL